VWSVLKPYVWFLFAAIFLFLLLVVYPALGPSRGGIIGLEVAGEPSLARHMIDAWTPAELADLRLGLKIDFLFIPAYAITLLGAGIFVSTGYRNLRLRESATTLACILAFAAALDVVENVALFQVLSGPKSPWPQLASAAAWPKLFLLFGVAVYVLMGVALKTTGAAQRAWRSRKHTRKAPSLMLLSQQLPQPSEKEMFERDTAAPTWRHDDWKPVEGKLGICCSGGGIRSAAYNLGALQALQNRGELKRAKFLSAVSGGSYIAAAYAMVENDTVSQDLFAEKDVFAPGSPEEQHLRNHTSYLAAGAAGKLKLIARLLSGVLVNILFFWLLLWVVSRPLGRFLQQQSLYPHLGDSAIQVPQHLWWTGWPIAAAAAVGIVSVLVRFKRLKTYRNMLKVVTALLALGTVLLTTLVFIPFFAEAIPAFVRWLIVLIPVKQEPSVGETRRFLVILSALGAGSLGPLVGRMLAKQSSKVAKVAVAFVFPFVLVVSFTLLVRDSMMFARPLSLAWIGGIGGICIFYAMSDLTTWSMYPFYKQRLCSAFALRRETSTRAAELPYDDLQLLSRYRPKCVNSSSLDDPNQPHACADPDCAHRSSLWPELVVCAAANITDEGATPTGRNAVSFTFSANEIGSPDAGWIRTTDMEKALSAHRREDITLPAAVSISGAAISPAMGKMSRQSVRALLAVTNARLGVWLPNPRWVKKAIASNENILFKERPRVSYLFREIFGIHKRDAPFLYVTDGGHWENLGLVELMRRGCTEIYCFDASGDDVDTFFTLGEAIALARTELGIEIRIDPSALREVERDRSLTTSRSKKRSKNAAESSGESTEDERTDGARVPPVTLKHKAEGTRSGGVDRTHDQVEDTVVKETTSPFSQANRTIATFAYPGPNGLPGHIIFCKTTVTEEDPWDVKAYAEKDPRFPTHSTVDQLYLDQRFEAYRALGWYTADQAASTMFKIPNEEETFLT
jgi:hypothetical protein